MQDINWLAPIFAAVAAFAAGALWYSPLLFSKPWQKEVGLSDAELRSGSMAVTMITAFVLMLIAAFVLALFVRRAGTLVYGLNIGFHFGLFFVATMIGVHYLFERRSLKLWLISAGYSTLAMTLMGGVIGAFP